MVSLLDAPSISFLWYIWNTYREIKKYRIDYLWSAKAILENLLFCGSPLAISMKTQYYMYKEGFGNEYLMKVT